MGFGQLDDRYDDTRKIKRAWKAHPRAVGLHAMSISYCNRHATDGEVDMEWLEEKLPDSLERREVLRVMVDLGLYHPTRDGDAFLVHDFLDHNRSKDERIQAHEEKVKAGRKGGKAPRKRRRKPSQNGGGEAHVEAAA